MLVAAQLQSPSFGLQSLNTWIANFETAGTDGSSKRSDNPWLAIAARNFLFVFTEYGIDQIGGTPQFVDAHLGNWEKQLEMEYDTGLRDYLKVLGTAKHDPNIENAKRLYDADDCEFDHTRVRILAAHARNIVTAAAHNSLTYIERALTSALGTTPVPRKSTTIFSVSPPRTSHARRRSNAEPKTSVPARERYARRHCTG